MHIAFAHVGREHLGISYLSAVLQAAGHDVTLHYDPGIFGTEDNAFQIGFLARRYDQSKRIVADILRDPPDVLAFPVYTSTFQWALSIARAVRAVKRVPTVFGGPHATLTPEVTAAAGAVDAVVRGEAESIAVDVFERLAGGGDWKSVANVSYADESGEVVNNPLTEPIPDLDALPFPDKALFENEVNIEDDYLVMTSRGCPYSCTYCCESAMNRMYRGGYLRRRSVESVIAELEQAKERYGYREVMFNDAVFFTDKEWIVSLMQRYRERIGVPFRCFGQILYLDRDIVRELKRSGCYAVEFGLQTTNDTVRKEVLGRREKLDDVKEALSFCDEAGLRYDIDHMFNLPGESVEDGREAALFYKERRFLNRIKVHYLTYFPGTKMFDHAIEEGLIDAAAAMRIREGLIGDFFHEYRPNDPAMVPHIRGFARLFKLLPLLPMGAVEWITRGERHLFFGKIPGPLVIAFQLLVALKGRDYRYWLYVRYYRHRIRRLREIARQRRI